MKKTHHLNICGKGVALNYSLAAVEKIEEIMGDDCDNVVKYIYSENGKANIERTLKVAEIMMEEGAAYEKIVSGNETEVIPAENLRVLLSIKEVSDLRDEIAKTIIEASERNVETEPEKNADTTQAGR